MFGRSKLMDEARLRDYSKELEAKSDQELEEEVRDQVTSAAFFVKQSTHDQKATKCWEESERRQKPWIYQRGYNSSLRDAGQKVEQFDLDRATEAHYQKEET